MADFNAMVKITPHQDGVHCGVCEWEQVDAPQSSWCVIYNEDLRTEGDAVCRCQQCRVAERLAEQVGGI